MTPEQEEEFGKGNLGRWRFYCRDLISPNDFIDYAFYYMISSALQRRVWTGSYRKPLFPNLYMILIGEPGVGKGLVITEVTKVLRHHKFKKEDQVENIYTEYEKDGSIKQQKEPPLLIPMGADATTYEALVKNMSRCTRSYWYESDGKKKPYIHASLCFCLEEISSLLRKHTEDLVNFLIKAYDCEDYRYETISRGLDLIQSTCLNFLGGTTPSFMRRIFGDELIGDGFASRTIFVYGAANRSIRLRPAEFSDEQVKEREKILAHILNLTKLHGEVAFSQEADAYLESWWYDFVSGKIPKTNPSSKLAPYYARKNITVQKLAMAIHFADSLDMTVGIESCKLAVEMLAHIEKKMHYAVTLENKNPLAKISNEIFKYLCKNGPHTKKDLLIEFYGELPLGEASLKEVIDYLTTVGRVKLLAGQYTAILKQETEE